MFSLKNKVTVHYTGSFDDGDVFDTTADKEPMTFIEGNHEVIPGFEMAVAGMQPGETKKVHLDPAQAYGMPRPELVVQIPTVEVPNYDDLVVGQMIYLMNGDGYQQLARVVSVQDDGMTVFDMNHPMAGVPLNFEITLLSREPLDGDDAPADDKGSADSADEKSAGGKRSAGSKEGA